MKQHWFSSIGLWLFIFLLIGWPVCSIGAEETFDPVAVVELFTSEGCSSCPPADILLSKLKSAAQNQGIRIFPLSFHVDYWNYLGWRDPYSQKDFTIRQQWYAKQVVDKVYTPQMIINGRTSVVGSDKKFVERAINKSLREPTSVGIALSIIEINSKNIKASFSLKGKWEQRNLSVALVEHEVTDDVARGENAGRKLSHVNVVRQFVTLAPDQQQGSFILNAPMLDRLDQFSIIAYMQDTDFPEILGATSIDLPSTQ